MHDRKASAERFALGGDIQTGWGAFDMGLLETSRSADERLAVPLYLHA